MQPSRAAASLTTLLAAALPAQLPCPGQGSSLQPGTIEAGPDMGCTNAPGWPWWHLFTPPHRAVVSKPGFRQGRARALPRILVHYRCTGLLLVPVLPDGVRTMGYVLDVREESCGAAP